MGAISSINWKFNETSNFLVKLKFVAKSKSGRKNIQGNTDSWIAPSFYEHSALSDLRKLVSIHIIIYPWKKLQFETILCLQNVENPMLLFYYLFRINCQGKRKSL